MMNNRTLLNYIRVLYIPVVICWCAVAYAAQTATAEEMGFSSISPLVYALTFVSATLGGIAGTLHRWAKYLRANEIGVIRNPGIFIAVNMFCAWGAGWVTFALFTHWKLPQLPVSASVLIAGFGGSVVIERYLDKIFPGGSPPQPPSGHTRPTPLQ